MPLTPTPTASPRDAVEAALDLFFRARHDPSIQLSAWDDLVATFSEQQHAHLEDATSVLRRTWPRHIPYPNLVGFVRWQVEKAERRDKELDRREKEDKRREREDMRREREDERREREDERREKEVREEEGGEGGGRRRLERCRRRNGSDGYVRRRSGGC